ncbi:hypothetical protein EQV77_00470 [Halobacillus fulvus]|nr:hypothetical protein EQV77_00470 [Halobacillus fulvus]
MDVVTFTMLFVLAVSIDSFGIGCVLGMKSIRLSWQGVVVIALLSGIIFLISSQFGRLLMPLLSPDYAERIGALALIGIGGYFLYQQFRNSDPHDELDNAWISPSKVLKDPASADVDASGGIRGKEVWLLGTALSLDTVGAGVSGALIGVPALYTAALVAFMTCMMLLGGIISGARLNKKAEGLSLLPGVLLIIIGLIKLT